MGDPKHFQALVGCIRFKIARFFSINVFCFNGLLTAAIDCALPVDFQASTGSRKILVQSFFLKKTAIIGTILTEKTTSKFISFKPNIVFSGCSIPLKRLLHRFASIWSVGKISTSAFFATLRNPCKFQ